MKEKRLNTPQIQMIHCYLRGVASVESSRCGGQVSHVPTRLNPNLSFLSLILKVNFHLRDNNYNRY